MQEFAPLEVEYLPAAAQFCAEYEAETGVPLQQLISEILRVDPRPASQREKIDMYGMRLYDINVRWRVSGIACQVLSFSRLI